MQQTQVRRNLIARTTGEHKHNFPQLLLGWRGEMHCEFERDAGRLNASTAAIVPANEKHVYAGRNDCSELLVVDLSTCDSCLSVLEKDADINVTSQLFSKPLVFDMPPILVSTVSLAIEQLKFFGPHDAHHLLRRQLGMMFVTQVYELVSADSLDPLPKNCRLSVNNINDFIDTSLETPPSNAALADFLNLGHSQMHMLFVRNFGKSPQQYVLQRRLQWAMKQLQTTQLPLARIAMDLGFSDSSCFSRAFRKQFGHAPSAVRRRDTSLLSCH